MAGTSRANVRASLPEIASRGANAGSDRSCANRTFHGQTLWDMYRYTHLAVPLATGARTLARKPRG